VKARSKATSLFWSPITGFRGERLRHHRKFGLAVIGKDGNLDCLTTKVTTGERVYDVIRNAYPIQATARKGQ